MPGAPASPAYGDRAGGCEEVLTVSLTCTRSEPDMARLSASASASGEGGDLADPADMADQQLIQI